MRAVPIEKRFGHPQLLAGLLLLLFASQCGWLAMHQSASDPALGRSPVHEGLMQWRGKAVAGTPFKATETNSSFENLSSFTNQGQSNGGYDRDHAPLWYLLASAAFVLPFHSVVPEKLLASLPSIVFGMLLGASLWYVARRLYGNTGGYVALSLYSFSPQIIKSAALWTAGPEMAAAWGSFGAIFTAIAAAHTLYAPREVVLWNWRRIVLLALSLALAVGSQFSLVILVPMTLVFLLYLASGRAPAAVAIWLAACALAVAILFASYSFRAGVFWAGLQHASFVEWNGRALAMSRDYLGTLEKLLQAGPAFVIAFPIALVIYLVWRRTRYFGNTAPLLSAGIFLFLALASPHYPGLGFHLVAIPFCMVFVAGIAADLLESRARALAIPALTTVLALSALWNLVELLRV